MSIHSHGRDPLAKRFWQPHPALFKRATRLGQTGEFYTSCTLQVPSKTRLGDVTGIRFGLNNGHGGCFATFHSIDELTAFRDWLTAFLTNPELQEAWAQSEATSITLSAP